MMASTMAASEARRNPMWVVILEMLAAVALLVLILWWTWPAKRKDRD